MPKKSDLLPPTCGKCHKPTFGPVYFELTTGVFTHLLCEQKVPSKRKARQHKNGRRLARLLKNLDG